METPVIDNPRLWRLTLGLCPGVLHAVMTSTVADSSLVYRRLPLDSRQPLHKALEEAVYSTPELLSDFDRIDIVVDTESYTAVPDGVGCGIDIIGDVTQIGCGGSEAPAIMCDRPVSGTQIVWALPEKSFQFLARTFRNAPMRHAVTLLLTYWGSRDEMGNRAKVFVHLSDGSLRRLDLVSYDGGGRLVTVSSKVWEGDTDVLYYVLAGAKLSGFDPVADEVFLCGDGALRHSVTPLLSKYVRHVLPLIFPSAALRAGKEAFKVPFTLIILPLCE